MAIRTDAAPDRTAWLKLHGARRGLLRGRLLVQAAALTHLLALVAASPAMSQPAGFNPADYGKAQLPMRQSTGGAAAYIDASKGAFEPIAELDPADPLAALARPVGRVDIVLRNTRTGEETGASCTGELLPGDYVLTNHHCLPASGELTPVKASILMGYVTLDGKASERFEMEPRPVEANARLDYAIARVHGSPSRTWGAVKIGAPVNAASRSLMVIHHPLGRPKVMSRFRCMALPRQDGQGQDGQGHDGQEEVRHRCDTLGGSSGSLLFDGRSMGVALHREGGLDPSDSSSFNTAASMAALLQASPILKAIADAGEAAQGQKPQQQSPDPGQAAAQPANPDPAGTDAMNAILRGR